MNASPPPELESLVEELRDKLVERLSLSDLPAGGLTAETRLFRDGLELDSLDALEITVLVEEEYGVVIGVAERGEAVFGTLGSLARFVCENFQRDAARLEPAGSARVAGA